MPPRRLEVIVVSARGFGDIGKDDEVCRREVELAVVSHLDSSGEMFGVKTSPWTVPGQHGSSQAHFGRSGLRAFFQLGGRHAPKYVTDPRFLRSAELRIRLIASGISTKNPSLLLAKSLLPTAMMTSAARALDKATAWIEAETRIPLEDMLASEPNSHCSGWRKLHRLQMTGSELDLKPLEVWMQAFVLPDAEEHIKKMNEEYREQGAKIPNFRANGCNWISGEGSWKVCPQQQQSDPPVASSPPATSAIAGQTTQPAPPTMVVVPPGVHPGMTFIVQDKPQVHRVQCPTGMKSGDAWQLASPTTGQLLSITIPSGVQVGSFFEVHESVVAEMECPFGATPGSLVEFKPLRFVHDKIPVLCPPDKGPGDSIQVRISPTNAVITVEIPKHAAPGKHFLVQIPSQISNTGTSEQCPLAEKCSSELTPSSDLLSMSVDVPESSIISAPRASSYHDLLMDVASSLESNLPSDLFDLEDKRPASAALLDVVLGEKDVQQQKDALPLLVPQEGAPLERQNLATNYGENPINALPGTVERYI